MRFKDILVETFQQVYKIENLSLSELRAVQWVIKNDSLLTERWCKPMKKGMPTLSARNRTYHYQKCGEAKKFAPAYFLHGKNGARYGLFRGNESNTLFAVNMKTKRVVKNVGKFKETANGLVWARDYTEITETDGEENDNS